MSERNQKRNNYLETTENGNTTYQILWDVAKVFERKFYSNKCLHTHPLWDAAKVFLRGNFIATNAYALIPWFQDPTWIPKAMDAQVPYIKWSSTVRLLFPVGWRTHIPQILVLYPIRGRSHFTSLPNLLFPIIYKYPSYQKSISYQSLWFFFLAMISPSNNNSNKYKDLK